MKQHLIAVMAFYGCSLSVAWAEEVDNDKGSKAITELCASYAKEDGIPTAEQASYIKQCLADMTGLSASLQKGIPTPTAAETGSGTAVKTPRTPEALVQNELVEVPDPNAEQLTAKK